MCKFCDGRSGVMDQKEKYIASMRAGYLCIEGTNFTNYEEIKISVKYCPECGELLESKRNN